MKNSLRAVNDRFEDAEHEPPPVRVVVAEGDEDVTIKARPLLILNKEDQEAHRQEIEAAGIWDYACQDVLIMPVVRRNCNEHRPRAGDIALYCIR